MYHPTRKCGVLTDFDLSVKVWLTRVPRSDRIGTIPFMAIELLNDHYWKDNTTCHYYHELEAFIWMLPFVFLAYDNGTFDPQTRFIEDWMTSDYNACCKKKVYFSFSELATASTLVRPAFKEYKLLMIHACIMLCRLYFVRQDQEEDRVMDKLSHPERPPTVFPQALYIEHYASMWDEFIAVLLKSNIDTTGLRKHRPLFDPAQSQGLFQEMKAIYDSCRIPT